jgi:hypothetical protein
VTAFHVGRLGESVQAPDDPPLHSFGLTWVGGQGGHRVVLVVQGEIPVLVLRVRTCDPFDPVLHDRGHLIGKGRVVGNDARDH